MRALERGPAIKGPPRRPGTCDLESQEAAPVLTNPLLTALLTSSRRTIRDPHAPWPAAQARRDLWLSKSPGTDDAHPLDARPKICARHGMPMTSMSFQVQAVAQVEATCLARNAEPRNEDLGGLGRHAQGVWSQTVDMFAEGRPRGHQAEAWLQGNAQGAPALAQSLDVGRKCLGCKDVRPMRVQYLSKTDQASPDGRCWSNLSRIGRTSCDLTKFATESVWGSNCPSTFGTFG